MQTVIHSYIIILLLLLYIYICSCSRIKEAEECEEQKRTNEDSVPATPSEENATVLVEGVETSVKLMVVSREETDDEEDTRHSKGSVKEVEQKYAKAQKSCEEKQSTEQKKYETAEYAERKKGEAKKYADQKSDEAQKYAEAKKKAEDQKKAEFLREWSCTVEEILGSAGDLNKKESDRSLFGTKITKVESFTVSIGDVSVGEYVRDPPEIVVVEDAGAAHDGMSLSSEDGPNDGKAAYRQDADSGSASSETVASAGKIMYKIERMECACMYTVLEWRRV